MLSFKNLMRSSFDAVKRLFFGILLFEVIFKILTYLIFRPVLNGILQLMLHINGSPAVYNNSIFDFILTVPGIIAVLLILVLSALFMYYEFSTVTLYAYYCSTGQKQSIWHCARLAFTTFGSLKNWGILGFSAYSLLLLPFVGMGITSSVMPQLALPNFITGELMKTSYGPWLLAAAMAAIVILFFVNLFMIPTMVLEGATFAQASKRSPRILRSAGKGIVVVVIVFLVVWAALYGLPRLVFSAALGNPGAGFIEIGYVYGSSLPAFLLGLMNIAALVGQFFLMPVLMTVVVNFYLCIDPQVKLDEAAIEKVDHAIEKITPYLKKAWDSIRDFFVTLARKIKASPKRKQIRRGLVTLAVIAVLIVLVFVIRPYVALHPPAVISHRGSVYGVENTLPAMEKAIESGADYTEVDVQLSRDGIPVVLHDVNLERLSGEDVNVYDLTAEELGKIDLSQNGYTGTIPTLEEAVQFARGRIKLGVELKPHGHETVDMVSTSIEVMERNQFEDFLLLSIDYDFVAQLKRDYPQYKAGYCVFGAVGDISASRIHELGIDFIVVEEWMVSSQLVGEFRKAWVPVYVWTVNDELSMKKYLEQGVLGIVTDYPDVARAAIDWFREENPEYYLYGSFDEIPQKEVFFDIN